MIPDRYYPDRNARALHDTLRTAVTPNCPFLPQITSSVDNTNTTK